MAILKRINSKCVLEPFPPGHYEIYEILDNGRTKLLESVSYHTPGDKPVFQVCIPESGE